MKNQTLHSDHESNSAQSQDRDTKEHERQEDEHSEKECTSEMLKKYLECLKPAGKRRRRCISQELG